MQMKIEVLSVYVLLGFFHVKAMKNCPEDFICLKVLISRLYSS